MLFCWLGKNLHLTVYTTHSTSSHILRVSLFYSFIELLNICVPLLVCTSKGGGVMIEFYDKIFAMCIRFYSRRINKKAEKV